MSKDNLIDDLFVSNKDIKGLVSVQSDIFNDFYELKNKPSELACQAEHYLPQLIALNDVISDKLLNNDSLVNKNNARN